MTGHVLACTHRLSPLFLCIILYMNSQSTSEVGGGNAGADDQTMGALATHSIVGVDEVTAGFVATVAG